MHKIIPSDLASLKQNKPSYVVKDLAPLMDADRGEAEDAVYEVLLRRGIFKWMAVRRNLIRLKDLLKLGVKNSITYQHELKNERKEVVAFNPTNHRERRRLALSIAYEKGYRAALEAVRGEIRDLCHGSRMQAPDNDSRAIGWLAEHDGRAA